MNIVEVIEMAKKSEYGATWFSEKGPIYISKEGVMSPAFTNEFKLMKEGSNETRNHP